MTNDNNVRRAHELLDELDALGELSQEQEKLLRSFLPDRPKDATLEDLLTCVHAAWLRANPSDWGFDTPAEHHDWLFDLRNDLVRILQEQDTPATEPAHPEFLETEADYAAAPEGTIVACNDSPPWHKFGSEWSSVLFYGMKDDRGMSRAIRRVLRWGNE